MLSRRQNHCRARLSDLRAPSIRAIRLQVRPFSESQIRKAMHTWLLGKGIDARHYVRTLFSEQPQLVPALRNPFSAELIAEYALSCGHANLPTNLYQIFDHYLRARLRFDSAELARRGVTEVELRAAAGLIASTMYQSADFGLEADLDQLITLLTPHFGERARALIEGLKYTRLIRIGGYDRQRLSFVHRRFAEFFVVDSMRSTGQLPTPEAIPEDSRWRDCLVVYC